MLLGHFAEAGQSPRLRRPSEITWDRSVRSSLVAQGTFRAAGVPRATYLDGRRWALRRYPGRTLGHGPPGRRDAEDGGGRRLALGRADVALECVLEVGQPEQEPEGREREEHGAEHHRRLVHPNLPRPVDSRVTA